MVKSLELFPRILEVPDSILGSEAGYRVFYQLFQAKVETVPSNRPRLLTSYSIHHTQSSCRWTPCNLQTSESRHDSITDLFKPELKSALLYCRLYSTGECDILLHSTRRCIDKPICDCIQCRTTVNYFSTKTYLYEETARQK